MRTLATQMRLKRLIREEVELRRRLDSTAGDGLLRAVSVARLNDLLNSVDRSWRAEAAAGAGFPLVATHVGREVQRLRSLIECMGEAGGSPGEPDRFQEAAVPLLFLLRGLDQVGDEVVAGWWGREPEAGGRRSA